MSIKIAVVGARKSGKTTVCSLITTNNYDPQCLSTQALQTMMVKINNKAVILEDTPGITINSHPGGKDHGDERKKVLEPPTSYEYENGEVRRIDNILPTSAYKKNNKSSTETTTLLGAATAQKKSPLENEGSRQGFMVVFSVTSEESYNEAKRLMDCISERLGKKVDEDAEKEKAEEKPPEIGSTDDDEEEETIPYPMVLVGTHVDMKNRVVGKDEAAGEAQGRCISYYEVNPRYDRQAKAALDALVLLIEDIDSKCKIDKEKTCWDSCVIL